MIRPQILNYDYQIRLFDYTLTEILLWKSIIEIFDHLTEQGKINFVKGYQLQLQIAEYVQVNVDEKTTQQQISFLKLIREELSFECDFVKPSILLSIHRQLDKAIKDLEALR